MASIGFLLLVAQEPPLTKEYIRLGGRIIATETPVGSLAISIQNGIPVQNGVPYVGSTDQVQFTATATPTNPGAVTWGPSGQISSTGLFQWSGPIVSPQEVQITASIANGPTANPFSLTVRPAVAPTSVSLTSSNQSPLPIQVTKLGTWTAQSNVNWIQVDSPVGPASGNRTVAYTVGLNGTGQQRTGMLTIAGIEVSVVQSAAGVSPSEVTVSGAGGPGNQSISVSTAPWQVTSADSWLQTTPAVGVSQSAAGWLTFTASVNPTSTPRSGSILVAGQAVSVTQAGGVTLTPTSNTTVPAGGSLYGVQVVAPTGTNWTVGPGLPAWIQIEANGSGSGGSTVNLSYRVLANSTSSSRSYTMVIGGRSFLVQQAAGSVVTITRTPSHGNLVADQTATLNSFLNGVSQSATWTLSGPGQLSSSSGTSIVYTAPQSVGANGGLVFITATINGSQTQSYFALLPSSGSDLSPPASSGATGTFQLTLAPPYSASNAGMAWTPVEILITSNSGGTFPNTQNSCYMTWSMGNFGSSSFVKLQNDSGTAFEAGQVYSGSQNLGNGTLRNSQCIWDLAASGYQLQSNTVSLTFKLLFNPQWSGEKQIYIRASNALTQQTTISAKLVGSRVVPSPFPPKIEVSTSNAAPVSGLVSIQGWAVDNDVAVESAIASVEAYVDNVKVGNANLHESAPSGGEVICTAQPFLPDCPNIGFHYDWNTSALANGSHTLRLVATDNSSPAQSSFVERVFQTSNIPQVAAPVFSPGGGTYSSTQAVTISSVTPGASIYYTLDSTTPTTASLAYGGPLNISTNRVLRAIATKAGMADSAVATASYTINIGPSWYTEGAGTWNNRRAITIDYTKVAGGQDLTNFPVLVSVTDPTLKGFDQGGQITSGTDFLFTSADGITKLDHEIESYSFADGRLTAWIRVPTLSASTNTVLYMYYGNFLAPDQQNKAGLWANNYAGVWHMSENSGTTIADSTSFGNNATKLSSTEPNANTGKIVTGQTFDGINDRLQLAADSEFNVTNFTIQFWANVLPNPTINLLRLFDTPSAFTAHPLITYNQNSSQSLWYHVAGSDYITPTNFLYNQWNFVSLTYNGTSSAMYINGQLQSATSNQAGFEHPNSGIITIGSRQTQDKGTKGTMDEVRFSTVARTGGWITTEYNNQGSPSTFYSLGTQESGGGQQPQLRRSVFREGRTQPRSPSRSRALPRGQRSTTPPTASLLRLHRPSTRARYRSLKLLSSKRSQSRLA